MCGLYGSIGFAPDRERIDMVAHRGPDGAGWSSFLSDNGPVVLGHRRLAIIDVSDFAAQPMTDRSERYHLIFNGEIYNYLELREEMAAKGEVFTTKSDSEVLLRAYMIWGEDCLSRLRGMFAFLIWDDRDKCLFAARDRYGIKPLYMVSTSRGLAFGSEIKQLLGLSGESNRMNLPRIHDFLASGMADHTCETMFKDVAQLRGGECLSIRLDGGSLNPRLRRWYPASAEQLNLTEREAAEQFRERLTESVRLHLRSDVPVGSCLSGGLDSSSIVCIMSNMLNSRGGGRQVETVSACYPNTAVDERSFMDTVAAHSYAKPHFVFPHPEDLFEHASKITWHQDEPFGSTSIFAQWCVFEEARRAGITVMLDGQGADEQLAGYHASFVYYESDLVRRGQLGMLARTIWERNRYHGIGIHTQLARLLLSVLSSSQDNRVRRNHHLMVTHDWLGTDLIRTAGNPAGALAVALGALELPPVTDIASLCMSLTYASNLGMLLHFEDRNSMAHSIEARVPFLDHPLVELSLGLGNHYKIVGGDTKQVLRRSMNGILPEGVRMRRDKLGFSTPEEAWFRGSMRAFVEEGIDSTLLRYPELLNPVRVRAQANEMLEGVRPFDTSLWRIISLGIWGERFNVVI